MQFFPAIARWLSPDRINLSSPLPFGSDVFGARGTTFADGKSRARVIGIPNGDLYDRETGEFIQNSPELLGEIRARDGINRQPCWNNTACP